VKSPLSVTLLQRDSELLETMGYRSKKELESGIGEYLAFCHREKTAARASELATFLNLGYQNLYRLCHRLVGAPPKAVLRLSQLSYAHRLLRASRIPIDEIGLMAGFGDRRTLYRAIQRDFGCSPALLRHAV
jgi:AraC-like DNA-binding protein